MSLREANLERLQRECFDVLIVGGGINGAVSAAALAARGARTALIDRGDFAGETSQASSNLAWGGIKYLESLEFGLVWKLCRSRNRLMRAYPSTVEEIRFFTTLARGFRFPRWFLYLGALLYWAMGGFFTKRPRLLSRRRIEAEEAIVETKESVGGFEYSDAYLHDNDARFTFSFVRSAMDQGCAAANYVESLGAERGADGLWQIRLRDRQSGQEWIASARTLINACGPYVDEHNRHSGVRTTHRHVFSKGVHLIVPRLSARRHVMTFFADDGRLFFAIPMGPQTCIGTTDSRVDTPRPRVEESDRRFILDNINKRLRLERPLGAKDIIAERCGVRPLVVQESTTQESHRELEWVQLSRKHVIEVDKTQNQLSIFGGKLTDCLNVGEEVVDAIRRLGIPLSPGRDDWYGEGQIASRREFMRQAQAMNLDARTPSGASEVLSQRLWRRYGYRAFALLEEIRCDTTMADRLIEGAEYLRCEILQAARSEMVTRLDDFLHRRSKIAWVVPRDQLLRSRGLREACALFFGARAQEEWDAYFKGEAPPYNIDQESETPHAQPVRLAHPPRR